VAENSQHNRLTNRDHVLVLAHWVGTLSSAHDVQDTIPAAAAHQSVQLLQTPLAYLTDV
jgi:hypothetical protein